MIIMRIERMIIMATKIIIMKKRIFLIRMSIIAKKSILAAKIKTITITPINIKVQIVFLRITSANLMKT